MEHHASLPFHQRWPPLSPPPRALLNSLLDAIASIPLQEPLPAAPLAARLPATLLKAEPDSNALRRVPVSHRHLIVTLHVLFPGLLLPALDLLDRGLVVRLVLDTATANLRAAKGGEPTLEATPPSFFLVHSAQPAVSKRRRQRSGSGSGTGPAAGAALSGGAGAGTGAGRTYMVRLAGWNCTCAAFAFSAFPPSPTTGHHPGSAGGNEKGQEVTGADARLGLGAVAGRGDDEMSEASNEESWSFGGMSVDGADEGVPVCKHLLACLLAERWGAALGRYVAERKVGREEMAGIVADV